MVSEALKRRMTELESMQLADDDRPTFILVHVVDASKGGDAHLDDDARRAALAAVMLGDQQIVRAADESVESLCERASKLHAGPEALPVLFAVPLSAMPAAGGVQ